MNFFLLNISFKRDWVSLFRFPLRSHALAISCAISLVNWRIYTLIFLPIFVLSILLFIPKLFQLILLFLAAARVFLCPFCIFVDPLELLHRRILKCWRVLFLYVGMSMSSYVQILDSSSEFQLFQSFYQVFGDISKRTIYNWYHRYSHIS